ncbi:hypothetical protein JOF56_010370 [Kibdelosporangium banguiense]|uniref:CHAP domain-containing protein n=1 Tax=Kibdelosporangium banguiense TaxID=1365924 RepID=A0ABS4TZZ9_9PSEU|nr:hypothetical protein [Kibdelosporangium banguiense]MBP2329985.1 hypothetical protein [Kibdelosporangium banguiense]
MGILRYIVSGFIQRRIAWRTMNAAARVLGARRGTVVQDYRAGDLLTPPGLFIVTIRPGSEDEVTQQQLESASSAGYTGQKLVTGGPQRYWTFARQEKLPSFSFETFPAGSMFRDGEGPVPEGHTGVVVNLGTSYKTW